MVVQLSLGGRIRIFFMLMIMFNCTKVMAQKSAADYIEKHKNTAIQLMKKSGIPASIILGISMIESAMGKSRNCKLLNNYFGVKGKNSLSKVANGPRSAYKEYPNAKASFNDFVRIVKTKKYYPKLKGTTDYKKWLHTMNQYGYAEAKGKWIEDISSVIVKYKLNELDRDILIYDDETYPFWGTDTSLMLGYPE